jgi:hypothetical protein
MKIYNDYMNDIYIILLFEFYQTFKPVIFQLLSYYIYIISITIRKYFYIPVNYNLNIKTIVIVIDDNIVFCNNINFNYFHFKIYHNSKYIDIRGNNKYILLNHIYFSKLNTNKYLRIYELPIKKYDKDECCICYNFQGQLNGLCGHQNVCLDCASQINKCPMCNTNYLKNSNLLEKILYI